MKKKRGARLKMGGKAGAPVFFPLAAIFGVPAFGTFFVMVMISLAAKHKGCEVRDLPDINSFLVGLPSMFLSFPIFLFLINCLIYLIPPARRMTDSYVEKEGRPGFWESQRVMVVWFAWSSLITLPLIALGFWI